MNRRIMASSLYGRVGCCVLFFVAASASFQGFYSKWHFREAGVAGEYQFQGDGRFGLSEILDGTATRPYVYRQLLPTLVEGLNRSVPKGLQDWLFRWLGSELQSREFIFVSPMARNPTYFFRYLAMYVFTFLSAWIAVYAMYLACKATGFSLLPRMFAPVLMILAMPYFMTMGGYYYDYAELAFLALALWMGLRFDWWWMIPLVALATWNKESFLLIVVSLYPILRTRVSRASAWIGTGVLCLVSCLAYFPTRLRFQSSPGGTALYQWNEQLRFLIDPMNWVGWERTYGMPAFRAFTVVPLGLIVWTVWRGWPQLSPAIRLHGQIAAAINFPLFFLFCYPGELRNLSMLSMVFLLSLAVNLNAAGGRGYGLPKRLEVPDRSETYSDSFRESPSEVTIPV